MTKSSCCDTICVCGGCVEWEPGAYVRATSNAPSLTKEWFKDFIKRNSKRPPNLPRFHYAVPSNIEVMSSAELCEFANGHTPFLRWHVYHDDENRIGHISFSMIR